MSYKSRKHIWSGALVLSIAIVGVLAAFVVLAGNPATTDAHPGGPAGNHCTGDNAVTSPTGHDIFTDAEHPKCADDGTPTPPPTMAPPADRVPDDYLIDGSDFVVQEANDMTSFEIVVEDKQGNEPVFVGAEDAIVRVQFTIHQRTDTIEQVGDLTDEERLAQVDTDSNCLPDNARLVNSDLQDMLTASEDDADPNTRCSILLDQRVDGNDHFEIFATTVPNNTRLGMSLVVGDASVYTHTLTFLKPRTLMGLAILELCPIFERGATSGKIELTVAPDTPGGVVSDTIDDHYILVRDADGAHLMTNDGSQAASGVVTFMSADLTSGETDPDDNGLLKATFTGIMRDTVYQVDVYTRGADGAIDQHVQGHVRIGN